MCSKSVHYIILLYYTILCAVDCVLRCFWRRELYVPGLQARTAESSRLQYTVHSQQHILSLNYKVQP
jgi:cell division protein FtsL